MSLSRARWLLVAGALMLASCAHYTLIEPKPATVGTLKVEPGIAWNRLNESGVTESGVSEFWTADGERLDTLLFITGLEDGKPLLSPKQGADKLPKFRSTMGPEAIASLFKASMVALTRSSLFTYKTIEPATVFGLPGVRLEYATTGQDDVDKDGLAIAAVKDGRLYLIAFEGTHLLHYGKYLPEVKHLMETAAIVKD